jgi:hypothetical protein
MVTELPAGGGDRGGRGGNSVGVIWGVPGRGVLVLVGAAVTEPVACGVNVVTGELVARKVGVEGPGYPGGVFVIADRYLVKCWSRKGRDIVGSSVELWSWICRGKSGCGYRATDRYGRH